MPSLKEIKSRIASVNSTRKITSAMKMVASSKLNHAQRMIGNMLPLRPCLSISSRHSSHPRRMHGMCSQKSDLSRESH